jgi:serine/threonine protein kinase
MAPEQIEGQEADTRTDIFAFGAILYEMVTGAQAFTGKSRTSLMVAILEHNPIPMAALQRITPPALERIVAICLAKAPDDRWQSARDLKLQLEGIAASRAPGVKRRLAVSLDRSGDIAARVFGCLLARPNGAESFRL